MYWPNIGSRQSLGAASFLALTLILTSHMASAQDARMPVERDIATLNQQIATKQQQIATLRGRPSPETTELNTAQQKLAEARAAYKANASADNESKAKNAEFKVKLAEIKYNKAHPDVNTLVDEVEQLQSQLANKQREAKEAPAKAAAEAVDKPQSKPVDNQAAKRQQEQQRQQEQELARSKQESQAQQKEIERLKAELAAKETKDKEAAAPVPVAKVAAPVAAPAKPAATSNTTGGGALKLITAQEVAQELQQLDQRLGGPGPQRGANDALYLKRPDTKATNKDKVVLRALGKEQYKGQAAVEAGQYQISVGFNQWPVEFSAGEAGQTTFVYDNSNPQKARLLIYNSGLESAK